MGSNCKTVVWFRRDLRIEDNPALAAAARDGSVLTVFIWCPKEEGQYYPGRVSRWWLKQSLIHLKQSLKSLGADMVLIEAQNTLSALLDCITAVGATKLVYNHLYGKLLFLLFSANYIFYVQVLRIKSVDLRMNWPDLESRIQVAESKFIGSRFGVLLVGELDKLTQFVLFG